jgi:uncharacterized cupredoxin-like copper-binding protein
MGKTRRIPGWLPAAAAVAASLLLAGASGALADHTQGEGKAAIDYSKARETGFGKAADPRQAVRTIAIDMSDAMRFTPAEIALKRGEVIRFEVRNSGQLMHEMVMGTMEDLKRHAAHMKEQPAMEHDEPNMLHVAPGGSGAMGWQFTRRGEFYYGCLVPGHFEAGMVGRIVVTDP